MIRTDDKIGAIMKTLPLLAATAIGLLGILAAQPSFAGSDHGGQVTVTEDDDQGAAAGNDNDRDVAENEHTGHEGEGAVSGSHQDDQGDDEDGDHQSADHDSDGGDSGGDDGGDGGSHDGGDGGSGGDSGSHDGGDD